MPTSSRLRARLLRALATLLFAAATTAQGTYYVNGLTGTDSPAAGSSASTPWKTITYAFAQIPPQTPSTSALLYVEGNQTYATQTNGESFPITPRYNVWVEGTFLGHGVLPILDPGAGGTALQLAGGESYFRNTVTYRYLDFRGGDYGIRMGSDPGHRHRPRVQDCVFRNQGAAGIAIEPNGTDADDPRFFQNRFDNCSTGILGLAEGGPERVAPDIEECHFNACGDGVHLSGEMASSSSSTLSETTNGLIRSCTFTQCSRATLINHDGLQGGSNNIVQHCSFSQCDCGISWPLQLGQSHAHTLSVETCTFVDCTHGIQQWSAGMPTANVSLTVHSSTFRHSGKGIEVEHSAVGLVDLQVTGTTFESCQVGARIDMGGDPSGADITIARCQFSDCDTGVWSYLGTPYSALRLRSTSIVKSDIAAIQYVGYAGSASPGGMFPPAELYLDGVTIADSMTGLAMGAAWAPAWINDSLFGGNQQDMGLAPNVSLSIQYSCFQASSWPGVGNLNLTDPLLVRPFYKLAPTSPCIDAGANSGQVTTDYEGDPRASVSVQGGQALPDIGADEYVYAGSARPYGVGGFGPFNIFPEISSPNASVRIGQPLQVDLTGAIMPVFQVHAFTALLSLGFTESPGALPFDLAPLGMPGSYLWNDAAAFLAPATVDSSGAATITWTLPNSTPLVGTTFTHQWFAVMPNPWGIISSDGLRVTVGQ